MSASRTWISTKGARHKRATTLTFTLPRAARLVLVVRQVSPVCRFVRRFAVKAHAGRNRVRFPARGSRWRLRPGTYRISASTVSGRLLRRATVVVLNDSTPTRAEISAARAADVCASSSRLAFAGSNGYSSITPGRAGGATAAPGGQPSVGGFVAGGNTKPGGVLGSTIEKTARAIRPWLVALLALSIALLAVGSVPRFATTRETRVNDLLARYRLEFVGLGAAAFVAVVIAFLLG